MLQIYVENVKTNLFWLNPMLSKGVFFFFFWRRRTPERPLGNLTVTPENVGIPTGSPRKQLMIRPHTWAALGLRRPESLRVATHLRALSWPRSTWKW